MECMYGMYVWNVCMECTCGSYSWNVLMGCLECVCMRICIYAVFANYMVRVYVYVPVHVPVHVLGTVRRRNGNVLVVPKCTGTVLL